MTRLTSGLVVGIPDVGRVGTRAGVASDRASADGRRMAGLLLAVVYGRAAAVDVALVAVDASAGGLVILGVAQSVRPARVVQQTRI